MVCSKKEFQRKGGCGMKRLALLLILLCLGAGNALGEITPLPLDGAIPGYPYQESGIRSQTEYQDESIHVTIRRTSYRSVHCFVAYITIAHASQLRTAMSNDSYSSGKILSAKKLMKKYNPVIAMNGDFFKMQDYGYLVRQGTLYRDRPDGKRDILLIDDQGDFYALQNGTLEDVQQLEGELQARGRSFYNTFNFGPVLVKDGEALEIKTAKYSSWSRHMRVAIAQLGPLEYAIFHCYGVGDTSKEGMTLQTFANFIAQEEPRVKLAYNMDGGGSAHVVFLGKQLHENHNPRYISDILYFASAVAPAGEGE